MDRYELQLSQMLIAPKETMEVEIKGWLDLMDKEHCALLSKAAIALANHGGGFLIVGFDEDKDTAKFSAASNRPRDLGMYGQDAISAVIAKHAEPNFHCDVHIVRSPADGKDYPILRVSASTVPVRSKIDSMEKSIRANFYYIRRPGPKSEQPGTGQEWDRLMRRCVMASRTEMVEAVRSILDGSIPATPAPKEQDSLEAWETSSRERWRFLTDPLVIPPLLADVKSGARQRVPVSASV